MRVMNAQSVKCVVCAGSSSEWVRCVRVISKRERFLEVFV